MWAVIEIGKKQYRVQEGDVFSVERLSSGKKNSSKAKEEDKIVIDRVLLLYKNRKLNIGAPYIEGAKVEASVLKEEKAKKIIVYKYKRRKKYRKTQGHRQILTRLKISDIKEPK
ncbi:MAG: 50S ribosomal protein L21 [Candidatus Omnitrophica bacterium 4484_171]|nr:MAG: 50S ribosomal protein L21 [Candidatus Omnitrophica bacterium 4484_171]